MPTSLASKDAAKANGQQQYIETVDPNIVDIRDDLIIADGEKDVSLTGGWVRGGVRGGTSGAGGRAGRQARQARAWKPKFARLTVVPGAWAPRSTASSGTSRRLPESLDSFVSRKPVWLIFDRLRLTLMAVCRRMGHGRCGWRARQHW